MGSAHVFKYGDPTAPKFGDEYEILKRAVLQVTDIKDNHNKYYAIELHAANDNKSFRVFTHYGRTDDLESNPEAGRKECRYFPNVHYAESEYRSIYSEKTSSRKGYREVSLASSKIGSPKARGQSAGEVDAKTLSRVAASNDNSKAAPKPAAPAVEPRIANLVRYLYGEATNALTTTIAAKITANGIETPLGILTVGQIEKGEHILRELYDCFKKGSKGNRARLEQLSGEFYTAIPHRIGRSRAAIESAVIDNHGAFASKQETLQLMKDMLQVNGDGGGSVLFQDDVAAKFAALACELQALDSDCDEYRSLERAVKERQVRKTPIRVKSVYTVRRKGEWEGFSEGAANQQLLFHGSSARNWVGILSRGLLLPKIAVGLGVSRTDEGWLGHGIYFGHTSCTSSAYAGPGRDGTQFMALARVALGRVKDYTKITYGLSRPPEGFDSCHGVRSKSGVHSEFADDEFVVYDTARQRLEYLVEFSAR